MRRIGPIGREYDLWPIEQGQAQALGLSEEFVDLRFLGLGTAPENRKEAEAPENRKAK